jgi:hypothetical protein
VVLDHSPAMNGQAASHAGAGGSASSWPVHTAVGRALLAALVAFSLAIPGTEPTSSSHTALRTMPRPICGGMTIVYAICVFDVRVMAKKIFITR